MSFVKDFIRSKKANQTVFDFSDLSQVAAEYTGAKLRSALKYALQNGDIYRISKGIYSISNDYSHFEFANKYRSPSYISLYSVLQKEGVVFQPYSSVYAISNRSEEFEVDKQMYIYRKIKDSILLNPLGVTNENNVQIASLERAICDKLYLDGDEYFDNLRGVNWEVIEKLNAHVYDNNKTISSFIKVNK